LKERDLEAEQAARDKELEEESVQLEKEIEQEIRGELLTSRLNPEFKARQHRVI
jgi:hypothetical protein